MKTWLKILIILVVVGLISAFLVWKFVINKSHPNYAKVKAEYELLATDIFNKYISNKDSANQFYTGKEIQIKGKFTKIEQTGTNAVVIFVFRQGEFGDEGIRCVLLPEEIEKIKEIKPNEDIILKGMCTGYNESDVMIEKCVFVKL